ncbi:hypothetical protein HZC07_03295 [Candidatus Micrarchaeota archaeon]|nr:hypothetical protein [Candidatus Micrarchaeota archaeon]
MKSTINFVRIFILCLLLSSFASATVYTLYGKIQNSSYENVSANVSLYNISFGMGGENRTIVNSTLSSGSTGIFNFSYDDTNPPFSTMYQLKITIYNSENNVSQLGPMLPQMPIQVLAEAFNESASSIPTITTTPAATINVSAFNASANNVTFGGLLFDNKFGEPVEQFFSGNLTSKVIYVPTGKNFTVVLMVDGGDAGPGGSKFGNTPPITQALYDVNVSDNVGQILQFPVNVTTAILYVNGTINVTGNSSAVNFSDIYLYPSVGGRIPMMMPPFSRRGQPVFNDTSYEVENVAGNYTMTAMGTSVGLTYMMMAIGHTGDRNDPASEFYGCFQNFTLTDSNISNLNCTVRRLTGTFVGSNSPTGVNLTYQRIQFLDENSGQDSKDRGMSEVVVNYTNYGSTSFTLFVQTNSSGFANLPLINGSNATVRVYNSRFAPREYVIDGSIDPYQINMTPFKPRNPGNLSNVTNNMNISFLSYTGACNVPDPSLVSVQAGGCLLSSFDTGSDGKGFNPLLGASAGLLNILITDPDSNTTVYYIGVDMSQAGPPDSDFTPTANDSSNSSTFTQKRRFGGQIPSSVYQYIYLGIPYNSSLNDSQNVSVLLDQLFDSNWNQLWNSTDDPDGGSIPSGFSDYNASLMNSSAGGIICTNDSSDVCFINTTTNVVWVKVPHFSGSSSQVQGSLVSSGGGSSGTSSSSTSSSSSRRRFVLTTEQICPDNIYKVYASSSGDPLSSVGLRLTKTNPYEGLIANMETNNNGLALFTIPSEGTYEVRVSSPGGYGSVSPLLFDWVNCPSSKPQPIPVPPPVVQPPVSPPTSSGNTTMNSSNASTTPPPTQPPANNTPDTKTLASQAIASAQKEIDKSNAAGKDVSAAKAKLLSAQSAFNSQNYNSAQTLAADATKLAQNAQAAPQPAPAPTVTPKPTPAPQSAPTSALPLVALLVVLVVIAAGVAYFMMQKKKK